MEDNKFGQTPVAPDAFEFAQQDEKILDAKLETKKIGFFRDAMSRFAANKGSIVAAAIIGVLMLFSIIAPFVSGHTAGEMEDFYTNCLPKVSQNATGFWDGTKDGDVTDLEYVRDSLYGRYTKVYSVYQDGDEVMGYTTHYKVRIDTYKVGCKYKTFSATDFEKVRLYDEQLEDESKRILQPLVAYTAYAQEYVDEYYPGSPMAATIAQQLTSHYMQDANFCYKMKHTRQPIYDDEGNVQYIYKVDGEGNYIRWQQNSSGSIETRINYENYYYYVHGHHCFYVFGSDTAGRDILTRLAVGGRLSLALGFAVTLINLIIGIIYGAIEGYYGGVTDLVMERISEILSEIPFTVVVVIFQTYYVRVYGASPVLSLAVAFIVTGWLGTAATTRMQFYRYKGQEYILASRTLGANDAHLIFRHILPNAAGTLVTSSVLMVPGVIFSESMLSYLNIINFEETGMTSIGTMLSLGQRVYTTFPHEIFFPALFISLLMICFNIFGNGLRDAFNPQLRGAGNE